MIAARWRLFLVVGFYGWSAGLQEELTAQEVVAREIVVSAERIPDPAATSPFSTRSLANEDLARAPQLRLDDILRAQVPGFSLFRRSSSRVAHPTTQGVTLRNFGPSGAGRTLVLLDGVPQNDPFAGYVLWNQLPAAAIQDVIVQPGGGAGLFGNAALAGTIFLRSRAATESTAAGEAIAGSASTYGASISGSLVEEAIAGSLFAEYFSSGGYPVLRQNQRGAVDRDASSESALLQLTSTLRAGANTSFELKARGFDEERGNGTAYTRNSTRGEDMSVALTRGFPALAAELRLTGYYQQRRFESTFSSVNAARDIETPALDQFDVPAEAAGGSAVWAVALGTTHTPRLGTDLRWVEGETNELFRFIDNEFTRLRNAGGEQFFMGLFAEDTWQPSTLARMVAGIRFDHWRMFNGHREEFDQNGTPTLQSTIPDRDGYSLNGRLGANLTPADNLTIRAAAYTGFRVPTLNELYRPFRVGNTVTEANPALDPEQLVGVESAIDWRPIPPLRLAATLFYNRLTDAVGNVTTGSIPGGVLRQRRNIDLITAPGAELLAEWQLTTSLFLRASYLWTEPTIARAEEPALRGRLLAQTPEHVVTAAAEYRPNTRWLFSAQARYSGRQFDDDQNTLRLAPFLTFDAAGFYRFTDHFSAGLKIENLLDEEIETGKTPDGLVSIGAPRLVTLQLTWSL